MYGHDWDSTRCQTLVLLCPLSPSSSAGHPCRTALCGKLCSGHLCRLGEEGGGREGQYNHIYIYIYSLMEYIIENQRLNISNPPPPQNSTHNADYQQQLTQTTFEPKIIILLVAMEWKGADWCSSASGATSYKIKKICAYYKMEYSLTSPRVESSILCLHRDVRVEQPHYVYQVDTVTA